MNFETYQQRAAATAIYDKSLRIMYPTLGLCGEVGELANKVKKVYRDKAGEFDQATKAELAKELGDVYWYCAALATDLGLSMDDIAVGNLHKLESRKMRGTLHGDGDNR